MRSFQWCLVLPTAGQRIELCFPEVEGGCAERGDTDQFLLLGHGSEPAHLCSPWQKYMLAWDYLEGKVLWYSQLTPGGQISWRGTKLVFVIHCYFGLFFFFVFVSFLNWSIIIRLSFLLMYGSIVYLDWYYMVCKGIGLTKETRGTIHNSIMWWIYCSLFVFIMLLD